jgi:hypothetical protein
MRTVILGSLAALFLTMALAGCKDNEQSFYIEHMKVVPDPPDCAYSAGDAVSGGLAIDLAFSQQDDYFAWFQTTNALVARENYDNLVSESNGIFVDGAEAQLAIGGAAIGSTAYRTLEMYLEPESSDVIPAIAIPVEAFQELQSGFGCAPASETAAAVAADLEADGVLDNVPSSYMVGTGTITVRILGHTQGDVEVETNPFSFPVEICCNCYIDWAECADPCTAFCEDPAEYSSCAAGINSGGNPFPGHNLTTGTVDSWPSTDGDGGVEDCTTCG